MHPCLRLVSAALLTSGIVLACGESASDNGGDPNAGGSSSGGDGGGVGTPCEAATPAELAACVDRDRYVADVAFIDGERPSGSTHWRAVQDHCANILGELGYTVERHDYGTGVNVIGVRQGASSERVVLGAHYDHIAGCPGANDNATGVAGLLEVARALAKPALERTLVIACLDEEERGKKGAAAFAARAAARGEQIAVAVVFDMIGYTNDAPNSQTFPSGGDALFPDAYAKLQSNQFKADFVLAIHDGAAAPFAQAFEQHFEGMSKRLAGRLDVPPSLLSEAAFSRSDHAAFWQEGYPAVLVTDTGDARYGAYHCKNGQDTIDQLDHDFAVDVIRATAVTIGEALGFASGSPPGGGDDDQTPDSACADLCALAPSMTQQQRDCLAQEIGVAGYPIASTVQCADVMTATTCIACAEALALPDALCADLRGACL
ncbi:MAG TPA: M20/M25/M40 family metallo-hydrolase [Nannocystis sp.]